MMEADERGTLARLQALRRELIDPTISEYGGRTVKLIGDGALVEFASVVDAVECAVSIQRGVAGLNSAANKEQAIELRIGINLGDVMIEGDDIYGDGVNVAARLEAEAPKNGILLSDAAYNQVRGKVGITFAEAGDLKLKNIETPVRVWRWGGEAAVADKFARHPVGGGSKPSIAILPFDNLSNDPEQEYFADGLVEDIITTLSKLSGLVVIARNSSFVYKGRSVDVREVAKELGVRYVLEGSVRKSADRIRITAQLIDAETGAHMWAERYDRSIGDIFAVQDEITMVLATEMQVRLTEGEQARLRYTTTTNVEAWNHWVQGLSYFRQSVTKDKLGLARPCWEKALALDPDSAALNAIMAFMHYADARFGWWDDRKTALAKAHTLTSKALALDPDCADAYTTLSLVLMLEGRYDDAVAHARKAVELAPGSADAATFACFVFASSGLPGEAVVQIEKAMGLSPNYPASYLGHLGNAYRLFGRIDDAIDAFRAYDSRSPGFGLTDLVIAYQQSDRPEQARQAAKGLLAARPNFTIAAWLNTQFRRDKAQLGADVAALRSAGLPMD